MKKIIIFISLTFSALSLNAQELLPNGGFENWAPYMNIEFLSDWSRNYSCGGSDCNSTIVKTTDRVKGDFAVKNITQLRSSGSIYYGDFGNLKPGTFNGAPYITKPNFIEFYYKLSTAENNSLRATFMLYFTTGNVANSDTIAIVDTVLTHRNLATFTHVRIPLKYKKTNVTPSHFYVNFKLDKKPTLAGEYFILDEVMAGGLPTGLNEIDEIKNETIQTLVDGELKLQNIYSFMQVFSLQGDKVGFSKNTNEINLQSLRSGTYLLHLQKDQFYRVVKLIKL